MDAHGNPTWIVTLEDRSRRPLGTIHIKANDGRVSRVEGMYQGRNMEQVADDTQPVENPDAGENSEDNVVKRNVKRLFHKTKEDANRIFNKARRSFADFIAPHEQRAE